MKFANLILFFLLSLGLHAQVRPPSGGAPSSRRPGGQMPADTVKLSLSDSLISKGSGLSAVVKRYAKDSVTFNVKQKLYHLYTDAKVEYGPTKLAADYIQLNWGESEVFAHGLADTSQQNNERIKGKPVFEDGMETYHMDTIRYNFKSRKAKIYSVATDQGEGYIHGKVVKKDEYDNLHLGSAKYTTCDLAEPHFHISAKKIMFINKKSAISGPFNIVVQDIPLPIGFFFGFFPVQPKQEIGTSGFIMGRYGEQRGDGRGFFFNDFGYYHAFNEKISNTLTFQIYTNGSFGVKEQIDYSKKYKYNGIFSVQYNRNVQSNQYGLRGRDFNPANSQFNVVWNHSPRSLRTDRSFSSNLNYMTSGFNASNLQTSNVSAVLQNNVGGSINYMRNFGKLFTSNYSFTISQNQNNFTSNLGYSMGIKQFNPFVKEKNQTGRWFESFRVGMTLTGGIAATNSITNRNTSYTDYNIAGVTNSPFTEAEQRRINELNLLIYDLTRTMEERAAFRRELESLQNPRLEGLPAILKNSRITNSYNVPITLPNIKLFKYINITPSISMRGDLYDKSLKYSFVERDSTLTLSNGNKVFVKIVERDTISYSRDQEGLHVAMGSGSGGVVVVDTVQGLSFANQMSFGASMNTRLYGTYNFGSRSKIQAVRHTVNPSISFGYTPRNTNSTYEQVRSDGLQRYLPKYLGGSGASSRDAGNIGFSISNQLEAKVRSNADSSETGTEKVMLLDNFNISTSYNIFADKGSNEFALSNIALSTNTSLFKRKLNINAAATLDPYIYTTDKLVGSNAAGIRIPEFKWNRRKVSEEYSLNPDSVGSYLSSFTLGASTSLNPDVFRGGSVRPNPSVNPANNLPMNPMDYVDFEIPWNLNLNYSANYNKQGLSAERWTMALSFSGDVSLTKNTKITFNSGWDFRFKQITLTTVGIVRELHCWMFSLDWTPISGSSMRSGGFNFTLRPKASLLKDLKITRRRLGSY